eukprot:875907-Alexandrium_andersonii.AAC.1
MLGDIPPAALPRALALHGLAPALVGSADGPLWEPGAGTNQHHFNPWLLRTYEEPNPNWRAA